MEAPELELEVSAKLQVWTDQPYIWICIYYFFSFHREYYEDFRVGYLFCFVLDDRK